MGREAVYGRVNVYDRSRCDNDVIHDVIRRVAGVGEVNEIPKLKFVCAGDAYFVYKNGHRFVEAADLKARDKTLADKLAKALGCVGDSQMGLSSDRENSIWEVIKVLRGSDDSYKSDIRKPITKRGSG